MNSRLRGTKYGICVESLHTIGEQLAMASRRDAISRFALAPGVSRHVRLLGSEGEQCDRCAIAVT
ncbi:hypothetical protein A2J04_18120 [Rhodococcus sp. EPR-279]|nr:hypothetical protein A2J02_18685 [Rhodococcus sp. EPR-147]KZF11798.1 hypothetical protein A2J04_18120 [Rhodococcus sp. EPR-279]